MAYGLTGADWDQDFGSAGAWGGIKDETNQHRGWTSTSTGMGGQGRLFNPASQAGWYMHTPLGKRAGWVKDMPGDWWGAYRSKVKPAINRLREKWLGPSGVDDPGDWPSTKVYAGGGAGLLDDSTVSGHTSADAWKYDAESREERIARLSQAPGFTTQSLMTDSAALENKILSGELTEEQAKTEFKEPFQQYFPMAAKDIGTYFDPDLFGAQSGMAEHQAAAQAAYGPWGEEDVGRIVDEALGYVENIEGQVDDPATPEIEGGGTPDWSQFKSDLMAGTSSLPDAYDFAGIAPAGGASNPGSLLQNFFNQMQSLEGNITQAQSDIGVEGSPGPDGEWGTADDVMATGIYADIEGSEADIATAESDIEGYGEDIVGQTTDQEAEAQSVRDALMASTLGKKRRLYESGLQGVAPNMSDMVSRRSAFQGGQRGLDNMKLAIANLKRDIENRETDIGGYQSDIVDYGTEIENLYTDIGNYQTGLGTTGVQGLQGNVMDQLSQLGGSMYGNQVFSPETWSASIWEDLAKNIPMSGLGHKLGGTY